MEEKVGVKVKQELGDGLRTKTEFNSMFNTSEVILLGQIFLAPGEAQVPVVVTTRN